VVFGFLRKLKLFFKRFFYHFNIIIDGNPKTFIFHPLSPPIIEIIGRDPLPEEIALVLSLQMQQ